MIFKAYAKAAICGLLTTVALPTFGAEPSKSSGGFIDLNFYPHLTDVDNDNVFTVNTFAKLPKGFSYFSLINIGNNSGDSEFEDTITYYTEQNLRYTPAADIPLDLTVQYNMRSGSDNDRLRLGFRWRLNNTSTLKEFFSKINLAYSINFHAIQIDHEEADVWQMEHVWKMTFPYISDRLYLAGFADHTFNGDYGSTIPSAPLILEAQLGYRLVDNLHAIAEYRINEFRQSDVNNLALGVQYVIRW